jgi:hypothetical protein
LIVELLGLKDNVADNDLACAAFSLNVARKAGEPNARGVWTRANAQRQANRWAAAGAECRLVAGEPMFARWRSAARPAPSPCRRNFAPSREPSLQRRPRIGFDLAV